MAAALLGAPLRRIQSLAVWAVAVAPCFAIAVAVGESQRRSSLAVPAVLSAAFHAGSALLALRASGGLRAACGSSTPAALAACFGVNALAWGVQVGIGHWAVERNQPGMASDLTPMAALTSLLLAWDWPPPLPQGGMRAAQRVSREL